MLPTVARSFSFRKSRTQKDSEALLHRYYLEVRRIERVLDALTSRLQQETKPSSTWLSSKLIHLTPGKTDFRQQKSGPSAAETTPEQWMRAFRYSQGGAASLGRCDSNRHSSEQSTFSTRCFLRHLDWRRLSRHLAQQGQGGPRSFARCTHWVFLDGFSRSSAASPARCRTTCITSTQRTSIRCERLTCLDSIADGADSKHAPYRKVLNEIHDSSSLYFAVLMHDTGKGLGKGHSAKGATLVGQSPRPPGIRS